MKSIGQSQTLRRERLWHNRPHPDRLGADWSSHKIMKAWPFSPPPAMISTVMVAGISFVTNGRGDTTHVTRNLLANALSLIALYLLVRIPCERFKYRRWTKALSIFGFYFGPDGGWLLDTSPAPPVAGSHQEVSRTGASSSSSQQLPDCAGTTAWARCTFVLGNCAGLHARLSHPGSADVDHQVYCEPSRSTVPAAATAGTGCPILSTPNLHIGAPLIAGLEALITDRGCLLGLLHPARHIEGGPGCCGVGDIGPLRVSPHSRDSPSRGKPPAGCAVLALGDFRSQGSELRSLWLEHAPRSTKQLHRSKSSGLLDAGAFLLVGLRLTVLRMDLPLGQWTASIVLGGQLRNI
jgi:hypothetical protein